MAVVECKNCGAIVDDEWSLCPECGAVPGMGSAEAAVEAPRSEEAWQPVAEDLPAAHEASGDLAGQAAGGPRRAAAGATTDGGEVSVRLRVAAGLLSVVVPGAGLFLRHRVKAGWTVLLICVPLIITGVAIIASTWNEPSIAPSGWLAVVMLIAAVGPYSYGILASAQRGLATTRAVTAVGPGEGVTLTVHRGGDVTLDSYRVYLDDAEVGGVQGNALLEITVAPGHHSLAVGARGERSPALEFDVRLGHDLSFDCGHRLTAMDVAGGVVDTVASQALFGVPGGFPVSYWVRPAGESAAEGAGAAVKDGETRRT